ncbi:DNA adenine methylase [Bergeriella denitrificans]|uniref:site-specific DNA-methyltransferase (adenine-specific) n=1 Tax=Bergeriella denitrificans TaxID=494 RepID=A0A378UJ46_BERDE|nr:DNA adenine methylase [Bergeriella denitrificans]STZ77357.1 Site-specific DNA methylase [Bergeriella denitrificans]
MVVIMLYLNPSKIRKGRPIGLPYQGSKKKISKQIVQIIIQNFGREKPVYDLFGGGGAVTVECLLNGLDVRYNDLCPISGAMLKRVISQDRDWLKSLIVSREEFLHIRALPEKSIDDEIKLLVNSFGYNRRSYLYSRKIADMKYRAAIEIIRRHDTFSGYRETETYRQLLKLGQIRLEQMTRIHQLQRLQQLEQLQQLETTAKDYRAFSEIEGAVLYCDPPYENSDMGGYTQSRFDSPAFYDWAAEMAQKNIVIISSYHISDPRFEAVFHFEKARSTLAGGGNDGSGKYEKLFMLKPPANH